jgi:hypothetical protein
MVLDVAADGSTTIRASPLTLQRLSVVPSLAQRQHCMPTYARVPKKRPVVIALRMDHPWVAACYVVVI